MATYSVLEPSPFTDQYGEWPNAVIVHDFSDETAARDFAELHSWEMRQDFWSTVPITVDVQRKAER